MNKKKKRKGFDRGGMRCPYCGSPVVYRSADGIYRDNSKGTMLYVCSRYPECDSYVRAHTGTNIPVGSMANHELRTLRRTAHHYFDQLYESGYMSKQDAYQWPGRSDYGATFKASTLVTSASITVSRLLKKAESS